MYVCMYLLLCLDQVYSTIWPAHATATESAKQISIKYFSAASYRGATTANASNNMSNMTTLFRSKESLDANGQPFFLNVCIFMYMCQCTVCTLANVVVVVIVVVVVVV